MEDSIFSDRHVAEVMERHQARACKATWDADDVRSASEDMGNILAELHRTNVAASIARRDLAAFVGSQAPPTADQDLDV